MWPAIPGRNERLTRVIQQPDSAFVRSSFGESVFNRLAHQRIQHRRELLRLESSGNSFQALRKNGLQIQKGWVRQNVETGVQRFADLSKQNAQPRAGRASELRPQCLYQNSSELTALQRANPSPLLRAMRSTLHFGPAGQILR